MMDPNVTTLVILAMAAGAVALRFIPGPCTCDACAKHTNERRMDAERARAKRHRDSHWNWSVPWGDERCAQCKLGHEDDRERVD